MFARILNGLAVARQVISKIIQVLKMIEQLLIAALASLTAQSSVTVM